jgi:hypothetical protein
MLAVQSGSDWDTVSTGHRLATDDLAEPTPYKQGLFVQLKTDSEMKLQ